MLNSDVHTEHTDTCTGTHVLLFSILWQQSSAKQTSMATFSLLLQVSSRRELRNEYSVHQGREHWEDWVSRKVCLPDAPVRPGIREIFLSVCSHCPCCVLWALQPHHLLPGRMMTSCRDLHAEHAGAGSAFEGDYRRFVCVWSLAQ